MLRECGGHTSSLTGGMRAMEAARLGWVEGGGEEEAHQTGSSTLRRHNPIGLKA